MTKLELAEALIKSDGKCFAIVASCFSCPCGKGWDGHDKVNGFWCGRNQSERLVWAENYIKENRK